jgi:hypothetical protein
LPHSSNEYSTPVDYLNWTKPTRFSRLVAAQSLAFSLAQSIMLSLFQDEKMVIETKSKCAFYDVEVKNWKLKSLGYYYTLL